MIGFSVCNLQVGKTTMDELAYSINGENVHYGTPVNPAAPGRIPGGSSSGSAVCPDAPSYKPYVISGQSLNTLNSAVLTVILPGQVGGCLEVAMVKLTR